MSVTKMLAVTIAGPLDRFDHIVSKYIYKSDIHIYMHNLFTLNELICNSASYKEMLIFLKTIL